MKKTLLFLLFLPVFILPVKASRHRDYSFRHLDTEKELSQNAVLCILQDSRGFMWFGTKDGLTRYDGNKVKIYKNDENDPQSIGNNTIWSLLERNPGEIWVGTEKGIYILDTRTGKFTSLNKITEGDLSINHWVTDIKIDKNGRIWFISGFVYCYDPMTGALSCNDTLYPNVPQAWTIYIDGNDVWVGTMNGGLLKYAIRDTGLNEPAAQYHMTESISGILSYNQNHLLLATFNDGVKIMDKRNGDIQPLKMDGGIEKGLYVRDIGVFSDGNIWIGTQSGLYIHEPVSGHTTSLFHNLNDIYSLSDNTIYSMLEDREGGIWIGTYFGGINYYPLRFNRFKKEYPVSNHNSIIGERVSGICEDRYGFIWIGTEDAGLCRMNPQTSTFEHFPSGKGGLSYQNVHDVITDGDDLWIGTFSNGINVYNLTSKSWRYHRAGDANGIDNNDIFSLFRDSRGTIWVGTSSSAFRYDKSKGKFIRLEEMNHHFVSDIIEDPNGNIWFATYNNGVYRYDPGTQKYTNYTYDPDDPYSISHYKVISMTLDSKNRLWFATESKGICYLDESSGRFIRYGMKDGFSNDVIYKIIEDNDRNLWLSSNAGLMRFHPESGDIRIFTKENGLTGNQFNYKSGYKDQTGRIYFGSVKGMISFDPTRFTLNESVPDVVITGIELHDTGENLLEYIPEGEPVVLNYNQSTFTIGFAALSYVAPEMNEFLYKMEGLENNWNYLQKSREITYSNLPPGKYTFKVKGSNNDSVWNEEVQQIDIRIRPPFWLSLPAYILYGCILLIIFYFIFRYIRKSIEEKNDRKRILFETRKEKEIYDAKIEFFTNVAHEVRTPVTLIKGPLEYLLTTEPNQDELMSNLRVMEKNTDRLLSLINQLLDFRKTESKQYSLSFVRYDVCELVNSVYVRFKPMAGHKKLEFSLITPPSSILADIDKEALTKVVSNLFTNAIKYAAKDITCEVLTTETTLSIRVSNDGTVIPAGLKEKIFEPFYQIEENSRVRTGSGLGLSLVKSLVNLHSGNVYLDVSDKERTTFYVVIPRKQEKTIVFQMAEEKEPQIIPETRKEKKQEMSLQSGRSSLLIVEDNEELRRFLTEKLGTKYTVFSARHGEEALVILEKEYIHVVVSDVVMPRMDGFELCSKIKESQAYSHIPVILLTAKTNVKSKIEGLESGADAYIEKPFSIDHLSVQISNLLNNRKKLQETFAHSPFVHTGSMAVNKADELFLNRLTEVIYKHMADPDFNVDKLAEYMNMSRSSLLRKIKGISEIAPNDFIKLMRLKRAAELLKEGDYKVNEVCFLVGFSSTSYFSKAFNKQFGVLPKDFVKSF